MTAVTRIHTSRCLLRRHLVLSLLRREPGRFLEIGCGRGELLPPLARLGFEGVSLEISPQVFPGAAEAPGIVFHLLQWPVGESKVGDGTPVSTRRL